MTSLLLLATWWAGVGVVVGLSQSGTYPGPQDSPVWAASWAAAWPVLWLTEER